MTEKIHEMNKKADTWDFSFQTRQLESAFKSPKLDSMKAFRLLTDLLNEHPHAKGTCFWELFKMENRSSHLSKCYRALREFGVGVPDHVLRVTTCEHMLVLLGKLLDAEIAHIIATTDAPAMVNLEPIIVL